jgi:hypothetical protein
VSAHDSTGGFTATDASIHTLAEALTRQHLNGDLVPSLVRVRVTGAGLEVGHRPLDGDHPSIWLTGHRVDDDTDAIGVVTGGRMFSVDDPSATIGQASIGVLVTRRGELASTSIDQAGAVITGQHLTGLVVDLLRRAVGIPTPAPPCRADVLFAQAWLIDIVDFTHTEDRIPSWAEIVQLHSAVRILGPAEGATLTQRDLHGILRGFAELVTWSSLRQMLDEHRMEVPGLNPGEGAWFDDGSFARRLLVDRPPLGRLRADVTRLLPIRLGQRLTATLDAAGLPHTCWPDPLATLCESA